MKNGNLNHVRCQLDPCLPPCRNALSKELEVTKARMTEAENDRDVLRTVKERLEHELMELKESARTAAAGAHDSR